MAEAIEVSELNRQVIDRFRVNSGVVRGSVAVKFEGGKVVLDFENSNLALVHHVGAKSGRRYITPVECLETGGRIFIFASFGGSEKNPSWYYNLRAHPDIEIELGEEKFAAVATEITGKERDDIYDEQVVRMPVFGDYQRRTERLIPVIEILRSDDSL
ncbi:nitroreductase/quinone reductase family protein [Amycolatopsis sp. NPDC051903]|uniref:nitroreductase/quinone reductase family protein n=1 Tax=Amycolatopsis sp. NPDC051903 TaxID=3363936 RepID=UPI0037B63698